MKKISLLITFLLFLTSCTLGMKMDELVKTPGHLTIINTVEEIDERIVDNLNSFAMKLYNELYETNKNVFISPASIYLALGMTYNGAEHNTALEMGELLEAKGMTLEKFNKLNHDLQSLMLGYEKSNFELANSIWIRDTYKDFVKEDFLNQNMEYYGAMVSSLDFNNPKAKDTINRWVSKNTKGRIKKGIDDEIHPLTVMFLINTIYFKANWEKPFEAHDTKEGNFYNLDNVNTVELMTKIDILGYTENDLLQGVILPYEDKKTSMFILCPKEDLTNLSLSVQDITVLVQDMNDNKVSVNLSMPKVKLEYEVGLKEHLINLGMKDAWDGSADFSKMADNAVEEGLHIADITHKSFLAIDEKGTEAAAMTKVEMRLESAPMSDYVMIVDKPYLIGIIDNKSGALLFLGSIYNPSE